MRRWSRFRTPAARPWLAMLVAGLVVTLALVILVRRLEDQSAQAALASEAESRLTLLDSSLARAVDSVMAVGAMFDGARDVTRSQFAAVARPLLARQPGIRALEWVPLVHPDEVPDLLQEARATGFASFTLREFGAAAADTLRALTPRAEYFPVWYVEPLRSNERALGLDLGSDPVRHSVLQQARTAGALLLSPPLQLVQDQDHAVGVVLVRPVYALAPLPGGLSGNPPAGIAPVNPSELRGFVLAVLRIDQFVMEPAVARHQPQLALHLFDEQAGARDQRLFPPHSAAQSAAGLPAGLRIERHLAIGGRRWLAVVQTPGGGLRAERTASHVVLLAGLLISALLARLQFQSVFRARVIHDTVERRTGELLASERRLIQLNHDAQQAAQAKTVFLASMTHEFRTPMTAILGLLDGLRRSRLAPVQVEQVDKAEGAARRLLRLVEDILDLSRMEAGRLAVERHPFRLETVLRDVLVASVPRLHDKPLELVCDIDPQVPANLIGDAMRLTQVLVNLTENAVKFTRQGDVVLRIDCLARQSRRVDLQFSVSDTGPGLSARDLDRLFKPFAQAEQQSVSEFGGSGLGLSIVRQLVELLGGELRVDSRLGEGSRFRFELSFGITDAAPLVGSLGLSGRPRVLLLETHSGAAASLQRLLQAAGAQVQWLGAADGVAPALRERSFDLALLADGFGGAAAAQVRASLADVAGLRVVRLAGPGERLRAGVGASQVAEKPLLPGALLALLHEAAGQGGAADGSRGAQPAPPDRA